MAGEAVTRKASRWDGFTLEERFWMKVDRRGKSECWEWGGGTNERGYGILQTGTRVQQSYTKAHRLSYAIEHEVDLHSSQFILHSCDNPPCVNPAHLRIGTQADNVADAKRRDRHRRGERGAIKLSNKSVLSMRHDVATGLSVKDASVKYGISDGMASRVVTGKKWAHIGGPRTSKVNKTHCINGHEFTPDNTAHRKDGIKRCRECKRTSQAKYRNKTRKEAA